MNFQQMILALQSFWTQQGCVLGQPYDVEKGAGTGNPHTYLRALGPEPWNVAYVEPCRRPTDGRYGENPNRLGAYYQFQVLLKPSPKDVLERYLRSLTALGIRPRDHDIRFVEDDWEQATLGAWGLGWEVWLNGMEITQFTYFQQVGGLECSPVSAEITYGLERIAMYLQGVDSVYDLEWGGGFSYREIHHQTEVEWSKYNFEHADPKVLLQLFEHYRGEAIRLIELGLVFPAYDNALKASHTFNTLEARGAVSVSERAAYLGRIRDLSKRSAEAFVAERERLGFPILVARGSGLTAPELEPVAQTLELETTQAAVPIIGPADLLMELGTEEIPARFLADASQAFAQSLATFLDERGVAHGAVSWWNTPRRLVAHIEQVLPVAQESEELVMGPPARVAFDSVGAPKVPAVKFAEKEGVGVGDLERVETPKGEYVAVRRKTGGEPSYRLLEENLPELIAGIPWPKSMRWGGREERFARPLHWIVALLGGSTLQFSFAGVAAGNLSRGHRFFGNETFAVWDLPTLRDGLSARHVTLDPADRRKVIAGQLNQEAGELGGEPVHDDTLLDEVVGLVEEPMVVAGRFDERFLELPPEVIRTILTYHQRMFGVVDSSGAVMPWFLGVSNNPSMQQPNTREGYEKVVAARLADGAFFFEQDRRRSLEDTAIDLQRRTFLKGMGTLADKTARLVALAGRLSEVAELDEGQRARRAAALCKVDLCTSLVSEFPELQGTIGRIYAQADGEDGMVAEAVFEHYLPRGADDLLPITIVGSLVAIADKADTLAACFGLGKVPTGSADPFGLRRAALGILRILQARQVHVPLDVLVTEAVDAVSDRLEGERVDVWASLLGFLRTRLKHLWSVDAPTDLVEAVLGAGWYDVPDARARLDAVVAAREGDGFADLMAASKRMANILRKADAEVGDVDEALLTEPAEEALHAAYGALRSSVDASLKNGQYPAALDAMASLREPLARFFEDVMVMAEDPAVRGNRLALLGAIAGTFGRIADFSDISTD